MREYLPSFIYEESEILDAVITAIESEIANYKNYVDERVLGWYIDTASGQELDRIGLLAGEPRKGRNDTDYRSTIKSKILSTAGTKEVLLGIAKDLTDDTAEISDYGAGQVEIKVNAETFATKTPKETLKEAIRRAKTAGVHPVWHWKVFESTKDSINVAEDVNFPKHSESDNVSVLEDVNFPKHSASDSVSVSESVKFPKLQVLETLAISENVKDSYNDAIENAINETTTPSETIINTLHDFPYVFDTDKFDFAEFS